MTCLLYTSRIAAVNQLSREIVEGKYTIEEAEKKLEEIKKEPGKSDISRMLASGVGSGGFCYLLGCLLYTSGWTGRIKPCHGAGRERFLKGT